MAYGTGFDPNSPASPRGRAAFGVTPITESPINAARAWARADETGIFDNAHRKSLTTTDPTQIRSIAGANRAGSQTRGSRSMSFGTISGGAPSSGYVNMPTRGPEPIAKSIEPPEIRTMGPPKQAQGVPSKFTNTPAHDFRVSGVTGRALSRLADYLPLIKVADPPGEEDKPKDEGDDGRPELPPGTPRPPELPPGRPRPPELPPGNPPTRIDDGPIPPRIPPRPNPPTPEIGPGPNPPALGPGNRPRELESDIIDAEIVERDAPEPAGAIPRYTGVIDVNSWETGEIGGMRELQQSNAPAGSPQLALSAGTRAISRGPSPAAIEAAATDYEYPNRNTRLGDNPRPRRRPTTRAGREIVRWEKEATGNPDQLSLF